MSHNKEQEQDTAYDPYGDPQAWGGQVPPPPPHMMPYYYGYPHMHPSMPQGAMPQMPQGAPQQPGQMPPPHMHSGYMHPAHMHLGHMPPPYHMHPGYMHPSNMHPEHHPAYGQGIPPEEYQAQQGAQSEQTSDASNPLMEQAQAMLEGALGEEAGIFKELLGTLGMNDKEFWKGAMVGAAAALLLSNENVRNNLKNVVAGAGDLLKSGGNSVKDTATQTASSVKQNVTAGSEIFRDTYSAGKEGFKESVERHQTPQVETTPETTPAEEPAIDLSQTQPEPGQ